MQSQVVNTNDKSVPTIYVITPTYARPQQKAELTRLCHTFLLVPNIHWIIIEDAKSNTNLVHNLLANCGVVYSLINEATPPDQKLRSVHGFSKKLFPSNLPFSFTCTLYGNKFKTLSVYL